MKRKRGSSKNSKTKEISKISEFKNKFRNNFREHTITAIIAAFGFLVALSWREPIQKTIDKIIINFNMSGNEILIQVITAALVTLIAVFALILLSKWESKK
jgi:hypothetical protein